MPENEIILELPLQVEFTKPAKIGQWTKSNSDSSNH